MGSSQVSEESASPSAISDSTRELARELWQQALQVQEHKERKRSGASAMIVISRYQLLLLLVLTAVASGMVGYGVNRQPALPPRMLTQPLVMFDLETGQSFQFDPESGQSPPPHCVAGLWCAKCRKWHPGPPQQLLLREPNLKLVCRIHRDTPLRPRP